MTEARSGLVIERLSKSYTGQLALDSVDYNVGRGEIHALLGHNGSGKSTLIKVLAGYHRPDPGGEAWLDGQPIELGSAASARARGLRFVHQDLGVIREMSVLDNVILGGDYRRGWWVADGFESGDVKRLFDELELEIDPRRRLGDLGPAEQTMVAIARAVRDGVDGNGALLLDEPTATLSDRGTCQLFALLKRIRSLGKPIVYVTHRLNEVLELADRVTVLRDGRRVATEPIAACDHERLVELIVGAAVEEFYATSHSNTPSEDAVLCADGLAGGTLRSLSFGVRKGEIVGFAGVEGSGREEVAELLFGGVPWDGGELRWEGTTRTRLDPTTAITAGMAYLPADRKQHGAITAFTVRENLTLPQLRAKGWRWLSLSKERADARRWLERMSITPSDPERSFATLSGGNQQRVLLARWLRCGARLFLLNEPTQGVDVKAKAEIYRELAAAAERGAAILIASADAEDLAATCDRVLVLVRGEVVAELHGSELTVDAIVRHSLARRSARQTKGQAV